jgi:hypothetical protein
MIVHTVAKSGLARKVQPRERRADQRKRHVNPRARCYSNLDMTMRLLAGSVAKDLADDMARIAHEFDVMARAQHETRQLVACAFLGWQS